MRKPHNLNTLYLEAPADRTGDSFQAYQLAGEHMARILAAHPPFCYAISGPWGSGKSTFLGFMREHLTREAEKKEKIIYITFNAWKSSLAPDLGLLFLREVRRSVRKRLRSLDLDSRGIKLHLQIVALAITSSLA